MDKLKWETVDGMITVSQTIDWQYAFVSLLVFTVAAGLILYGIRRDRKQRRVIARLRRGAHMSTPEQHNFERRVIANVVEEALLEVAVKGELTDDRVKQWRRWFANLLDDDDLLSPGQKTLKRMLKEHRKGMPKVNCKPNIPGEQPIQDIGPHRSSNVVSIEPARQKKFGDKAFALKAS